MIDADTVPCPPPDADELRWDVCAALRDIEGSLDRLAEIFTARVPTSEEKLAYYRMRAALAITEESVNYWWYR